MNLYSVKGKIGYNDTCGCEYCEGHDIREWLELKVEAPDEKIAIEHSLELAKTKFRDATDFHWCDRHGYPDDPKVEFIREITEEELLKRAGAVTLWTVVK